MSLSAEEYDASHNTGPSKAFIDSVLQSETGATNKLILPCVFCREIFIFLWKFLKQTISPFFLEWISDTLGALDEVIDWKRIKRRKKALKLDRKNAGYRYAPHILTFPLEAPLTLYKVTQNREKDGRLIMPDQNDSITEKHLSTLRKTNPWLKGILRQSWVMAVQPPLEPSQAKRGRAHKKMGPKTRAEEQSLGLDDIFTNPIHNFFEGDKDFNLQKPGTHKQQPERPKFKSSSPITARLDRELRHLISLCKKPHVQATSNNSPSDTTSAVIQAHATEPALSTKSRQATFVSSTSEPISASPIQTAPPAHQPLPEITSRISLDATVSRLRVENPASKPKPDALLSRASNQKGQMPIYQEMTDEISGAEHMARNNRILHNSISKLTDAYFQKAAQETAPDYY